MFIYEIVHKINLSNMIVEKRKMNMQKQHQKIFLHAFVESFIAKRVNYNQREETL